MLTRYSSSSWPNSLTYHGMYKETSPLENPLLTSSLISMNHLQTTDFKAKGTKKPIKQYHRKSLLEFNDLAAMVVTSVS